MNALEAVRATYGVVELCSPRWISGMALGREPDRRAVTVIRILGARHVMQALLTARAGKRAHRMGSRVDALHAVSMIGLAIVDERRRRPALLSAAIAAAFGLGELL